LGVLGAALGSTQPGGLRVFFFSLSGSAPSSASFSLTCAHQKEKSGAVRKDWQLVGCPRGDLVAFGFGLRARALHLVAHPVLSLSGAHLTEEIAVHHVFLVALRFVLVIVYLLCRAKGQG
jgi:hypothetical protein